MSDATESLNERAVDYAKRYIAEHNSQAAAGGYTIPPEHTHIYAYLAESWLEWNANRDKTIADKETQKQEIDKLFPGLTRYYIHANPMQEELIKISVLAARRTLLAESLLVALDKNKKVTDYATLVEETAAILQRLFPEESMKKLVIPEEGRAAVLNAIKQSYKADNKEASREASQTLRKEIQEWVKHFADPAIDKYDSRIEEFRKSRDQRTKALNAYQDRLERLERQILEAMQELEDTRKGNNADQQSYDKLLTLWTEIEDRNGQVELLRNGLIPRIPRQPDIMSHLELWTEKPATATKLHKIFSKEFTLPESSKPGRITLSLKGVESNIRAQDSTIHPLIESLATMRNGLSLLVDNCGNPVYRQELPNIKIVENGVKSWQRTIEKLIYSKDHKWEQIADLSRINIVFRDTETMFYYNQAFRDIATGKEWGWHLDPPDPDDKPFRDEGIKIHPTGTVNWPMKIMKKMPDGEPWAVEAKLDTDAQHRAELVSHMLYACTRMLEGKKRGVIDFEQMTPENFRKFKIFTLKTVNRLLEYTQNSLTEPVRGRLNMLRELLTTKYGADGIRGLAQTIFTNLQQTEMAACVSNAKETPSGEASPSVAALYHDQFHKLLKKMQGAGESRDKIKAAEAIYEECGPRLGKEFQHHHLDRNDDLVKAHRQGWGIEAEAGRAK